MNIVKSIKKKIPERTKQYLLTLIRSSDDPDWLKYKDIKEKRIFVFLAGFYPNLGDMAITYAQVLFLRQQFPRAEIICVSSNQTYGSIKTIKTFIHPDDLITIAGGGNMDDLYASLEDARLYVVKSFPNNKIISFPQTFAFSDTSFGRKRLEISHKIYSRHKNLTIFVREPYSLERIKKAFPDIKIGYCPDIVLSLKKDEPRYQRHGVLYCMRSDKEQSILAEQREQLIRAVHNAFEEVTIQDTIDVAFDDCKEDRFEQTLEKFWDMLRHKEVVITDRLHCMIFCFITGTPCVVMDNSNHKVFGVYQAWMRNASYIRFVDNIEPEAVVHTMKEMCIENSLRSIELSKQFEPLKNCVLIK